jgi:hypothetical protein
MKLYKLVLFNFFLIIISFLLGFYYAKKDITVYEKGKYTEVFPAEWPTYNLPLVEYSYLLKYLNNGNIDDARRRLESFLQRAFEDANYRLSYATDKQKSIIKRAIETAENNLKTKKTSSPNPKPSTEQKQPPAK